MKASPGARSWMAAGVRHELLTRALPALRHEMAAPVSVIRMAILLLKRQVASATGTTHADSASVAERVDLIEDQVAALAAGVRSLRDWELATHDEGITRSALVAQCTTLMRVAFDLHGIGLVVDEALAPREGEPLFEAGAALRYMVLGALGYLHDSVPELGEIKVEADGAEALCFVGGRGSSEPADPVAGAHRAPRALAIDAVALQALADGLGYEVSVEGAEVRFALGTIMVPA
jgi:predicted nucleic acid-binding protein